MDKKIIVARYNEDVSWTKNIDFAEVIIYNKGEDEIPGAIPLPNVGREAGTYLNFIIDNYDQIKLDTLYFFLQGDPFAHGVDYEVMKLTVGPMQLGGTRWAESVNGQSNRFFPIGFPLQDFCEMIFVESPVKNEKTIEIIGGANFCTYGFEIKKRCRNFYEFLNMYAQTLNPIEGHIMERIWKYIFYTGAKDKITEYSKRRKAFTRNANWSGMKID